MESKQPFYIMEWNGVFILYFYSTYINLIFLLEYFYFETFYFTLRRMKVESLG